jgi:lipoprotein-anchoring transpeptidase ErfK/SrfK
VVLPIRVAVLSGAINIRGSMKLGRFARFFGGLAVLALLAGCEEMNTAQQTAANAVRAVIAPTPSPGYWNGDDVSGSPRIVVHLAEQKAYFYKGKHLVGESTVSTGKAGFGTPPGHYHVVSKDRDHVSSEFGDYVTDDGTIVKSNIDQRKDSRPRGTHFDGARMPYCMHFNGGYAMHEGYVPPYAASHGCIRVPKGMAEHFFNAAQEGTPILVKE